MNKPLLIGLHGKPRVGKDTVANYLIKKYDVKRYGPSVRVKDTAAAMFDVPRSYFDDDNMKDAMDPFWGITYRQMAQKVGKESSRDVFGDDIWMRHVEKQLNEIQEIRNKVDQGMSYFVAKLPNGTEYSGLGGLVLADIRYASEIEWVKTHGGDVFFVLRKDAPKSSDQGHVVDQGLPLELADMIIYNDGTIEELYTNVDNQMAGYYSWED